MKSVLDEYNPHSSLNTGDNYTLIVGYSSNVSPMDEWDAQVTLCLLQNAKRQRLVQDPLIKLRLPRSDIRKAYSGMLANVLNSSDYTLLYGFWDTFLTSTAHQITGCQPDKYSLGGSFPLRGVLNVFRFWCSTLHLIPDSVLKLRDTTITIPASGCGSLIASTFTLEFTSIYDAPFPGTSVLLSADEFEEFENPNKTLMLKNVLTKMSERLCRVPLRSRPVKIATEGRFVLSLDDEKRIRGVDWRMVDTWSARLGQQQRPIEPVVHQTLH